MKSSGGLGRASVTRRHPARVAGSSIDPVALAREQAGELRVPTPPARPRISAPVANRCTVRTRSNKLAQPNEEVPPAGARLRHRGRPKALVFRLSEVTGPSQARRVFPHSSRWPSGPGRTNTGSAAWPATRPNSPPLGGHTSPTRQLPVAVPCPICVTRLKRHPPTHDRPPPRAPRYLGASGPYRRVRASATRPGRVTDPSRQLRILASDLVGSGRPLGANEVLFAPLSAVFGGWSAATDRSL